MGASSGCEIPVRLLGLGNELLADDAFGIRVAGEVQRRFGSALDVVTSSASGFHLLDAVLGVRRLIVVDTVASNHGRPGSLTLWTEAEAAPVSGGSPHAIGLFEVLAAARQLGLPAAEDVVILGVAASDCTTVGGPMHADVEAAIPAAVETVSRLLGAVAAGEVPA